MATLPGGNRRGASPGERVPRPPGLDKLVRVGRDANDIYDMCGWVDSKGHHPGDGVPRLLCYDGEWTLWYLVRHEGETVLTAQPLDGVPFEVTEDVALALAVFILAACEDCKRAA
jgi:hypothetical protein